MALVFYLKRINGKLYPKAAREGKPVAYCNEVFRKHGKLVSKYIGIRAVPKGAEIEEK